MKHYAGLDVSVKETSVCILDETGRICREIKIFSHPEDRLAPGADWARSGLALAMAIRRAGRRRFACCLYRDAPRQSLSESSDQQER
jgi:predicted NBD/HSP70 family sugar kinase